MKITRKSPCTGKWNEKEINITPEQLVRYIEGVELIQNIAPNLSAADREFLISGNTAEDWDSMFKERE